MQTEQIVKKNATLKKQLIIFSIVYLCYLLAFFSRLLINPILPLVSEDLTLTHAQMGGFLSAFYLGYIFTNLPGGLLTDRYGYRKVILGTLLALGITTILFGFVNNYPIGFFVRVLAGAGSGATFSACLRAVFEWFPNSRGFATGMLQTGTTGGLMLANLLAPPFSKHYDWQTTFYVMGSIPLVVLVFAYFFLSESPSKINVTEPPSTQQNTNFWKDVLSMFENRNLIILGIAGFFAMAATWGTAAWANTYLNKGLNISLVAAGAWMSIYALASVITKPFSGFMMDKFSRKNKKYLLALLLFILAPALIWFSMNKSVSMLYFLIPLLGITAFAYSPVMNTFIGELVPVGKTGAAVGFVNTIWQLGSLSAPIGMGLILDNFGNSYFYAFTTLAICAILSGLTVLFIKIR